MGIFGPSKQEEEELRNAANIATSNSRNSFASHTGSSGYETALEFVDAQEFDQDSNTIYTQKSEVQPQHQPEQLQQEPIPNTEGNFVLTPPIIVSVPLNEEQLEAEENYLNQSYNLQKRNSPEDLIYDPTLDKKDDAVTRENEKHSLDQSSSNNPNEVELVNLDWDDSEDPENPQNWSALKKWWITITVAITCLCCSLGSSLYTGAIPEMMVRFNASTELCLVGLTLYLVGLATGPLLCGPLSEKIGRRWIYVITFPIGMLFNLGIGFATNIRTILVLRFFVGYFGSPALAIAAGTIADLWSNSMEDLSFAVALFCLAPFLGPVIGPIVGGFAGQHKDWKWPASWVYLMFAGAAYSSLAFCPETHKAVLLKKRAKKRGIKVIQPVVQTKALLKFIFFRPAQMIAYEPIVSLMSLYVAFVFAVLFGFFEAFPIIFRGVHRMELGVSGLPFISVGLGLATGVVIYLSVDAFYFFKKNPDGTRGRFKEDGTPFFGEPEERLLVGKIGAICLPASLFWLGWTGRDPNIHWMAPTAAGFPFGIGLILIFFSVVGYFQLSFPPINVASAMSANNVLRYTLASVFPLFTTYMYEDLGIGWASSLFGFIALALLPVPFLFSKVGPRFRARSRFGYVAYYKELAEQKREAEAKHPGHRGHEEEQASFDHLPQKSYDVEAAVETTTQEKNSI